MYRFKIGDKVVYSSNRAFFGIVEKYEARWYGDLSWYTVRLTSHEGQYRSWPDESIELMPYKFKVGDKVRFNHNPKYEGIVTKLFMSDGLKPWGWTPNKPCMDVRLTAPEEGVRQWPEVDCELVPQPDWLKSSWVLAKSLSFHPQAFALVTPPAPAPLESRLTTIHRMEMLNPVTQPGLNITVRSGDKWLKARPGNRLHFYRVGIPSPHEGRGVVVSAVEMEPGEQVPDSLLRFNHDPAARTRAGLDEAMVKAYGPDWQKQPVVIVSFWC